MPLITNEKKLKQRFTAFIIFIMMTFPVFADEPVDPSLRSRIQDSLSQTWESRDYELYIPTNTWHNRHYYTAEKINGFNERPWGLGLGKYRYDNDGDWHAVYAMAFQDSNYDVEPIAGYGFQKMWRPTDDLRFGVGYTVGVTLRKDLHYLPIPVIAPLFSVEYKHLAVQSTYIPGGEGHGNILFTWLRWQLQY
jgi:palmitoyl transferase